MALRDQQEMLWRLIVAPEGPMSAGVPAADVARALDGDERFTALERVNVYAEAYFWRIHDALGEDFPKLRAAAGPELWHDLVTDYVSACPSEHPSLTWMGARLPGFLRAHASSRLADLAELEWARAEIFLAADAAPIAAEALRGIDPERFAAARFRLVPALRVLRLVTRADLLWRALEDGAQPEQRDDPVVMRVWREGFTVYHRGIVPAEAEALDLARAGKSLAEVCAVFATPPDAFGALSSWVNDGLVAVLEG